MSIHFYDLQTCAFIQEKQTLALEKCSRLCGKSTASIKRSISAINEYLAPEHQILISNNQAVFQMTYLEYLAFIQSLTLEDYVPSQTERLDIMTIYAFFNLTLNMSHLYETLHFSLSTKKKDSRALSEWLQSQGLDTEVVPKTGIRIAGDELNFRICVVTILSRYLEVDQDFRLTKRLANNPLQSMIAEYFLITGDAEIQAVWQQLREFIAACQFRISYASVKFLYIYMVCATFRQNAGYSLKVSREIPVPVRDFHLMDQAAENMFVNHLISSLDFSTRVMPPVSEQLFAITQKLICKLQNNIITWIRDDHFIYEEVYAYLHKSLIRNTYHFSFYDNKLEETKEQYHRLYDVIRASITEYEGTYQTRLNHFQIASLTLIFRKFINRNKLAGRNRKKLVIVTNSSIEKIDFFMERMKFRVDAELLDVININELYLLPKYDYDFLIVFSNRIATMLDALGYSCVKLHFYLTEPDFDLLNQLGFSTSRRKLKIHPFLSELQGMDEKAAADYLLEHYSDYFLE